MGGKTAADPTPTYRSSPFFAVTLEIQAPFVFNGDDAVRRHAYSTHEPPSTDAASQKRRWSSCPSMNGCVRPPQAFAQAQPTNSGCVPCATQTASRHRKANP